jgi:hypothetical protein
MRYAPRESHVIATDIMVRGKARRWYFTHFASNGRPITTRLLSGATRLPADTAQAMCDEMNAKKLTECHYFVANVRRPCKS